MLKLGGIFCADRLRCFRLVGRQWDAEAVGCTAGLCNISGRGEGAGRTTQESFVQIDYAVFGRRIAAIRKKRGLTQEKPGPREPSVPAL